MEHKNKKKRNTTTRQQSTGLKLNPVTAMTPNQKRFFQDYPKYQVLSLTGFAGTGKSFIALYQALKTLEDNPGKYTKLIIIRSSVASRDIGFMPGDKNEKMGVYENPYISICSKLYGRGDAYNILKQKGIIQFEPSSFLRGETFDDAIVIVDEAQNMLKTELYTILTRVGENCKMIICGDMMQDDLTSERYREKSGYSDILSKLEMVSDYYSAIRFEADDIVRSGFVKSFILATSL